MTLYSVIKVPKCVHLSTQREGSGQNILELKSTAMNQRQESWHVQITDKLYLITLLLQLIAKMPL